MSLLSLENVSFSYGKNQVVNNLSLEVQQGEFITLLGSSGCGKTTILRLISGFLNPSEGLIKINGIIQNGILPDKRKIGMVFQDYALFPHMTVEQNLLYGLKLKKELKGKIKEQQEIVFNTAKSLGIEELLKRYPNELSGGQQQRVALGRALVLEPHILLMDEPLSSLDAKLRIKVREELKEIQQRLKITTIYVTHDQDEALGLSDKIALLNQGQIVQYDVPAKLYFEPNSKFTADFIGQANFIEENNKTIVVRPEWIKVAEKSKNKLCGKIIKKDFLGNLVRYKIETSEGILIADHNSFENNFGVGDVVSLDFLKKWEL